jgi:GNAT superfamily N-acetyltransferase
MKKTREEIMINLDDAKIKDVDKATYRMIKALYMELDIEPKLVFYNFPGDIIEGIYQGKYFVHTENTTDRVYVVALHPTLSTSFYTEGNAICIYNLSVAKELRGTNIGSKALGMYKLAGMCMGLDVKLRAVPIELHSKMCLDASITNGSKKFKQYEQGIARHTSGLIKFYEKNGFTLTGEGLGAEMEFKITDKCRAQMEEYKKHLLTDKGKTEMEEYKKHLLKL